MTTLAPLQEPLKVWRTGKSICINGHSVNWQCLSTDEPPTVCRECGSPLTVTETDA